MLLLEFSGCPEPRSEVSRPKVRSVSVPKCLGSEVSGHFGPSAEMSFGHFGTGSEVSQCRSVLGPKCPPPHGYSAECGCTSFALTTVRTCAVFNDAITAGPRRPSLLSVLPSNHATSLSVPGRAN